MLDAGHNIQSALSRTTRATVSAENRQTFQTGCATQHAGVAVRPSVRATDLWSEEESQLRDIVRLHFEIGSLCFVKATEFLITVHNIAPCIR